MINMKMYINGEWIEASNKETMDVENPANNEIVANIPKGTRDDAKRALVAAQNAQKSWALLPAQTRAEYIYNLAEEIRKDKSILAKMLTDEQGKPIGEAEGEIDGAVLFLKYASEWARRIEGDILTSENQDEQIWIQRVPFGVTVALCAWNFPFALAARKLGNALVCGNTMVVKPPSVTPVTVMKIGEYADKVGIPKGVINIIAGSGSVVGDELVRNPITKLVTLTGSTNAGRALYKSASENITVLRLELGGKAPFIVMEDADVEKAVNAAVVSRFSNCGQICTCNERMYIHEKVYDEFKDKFLEKVKEIKVGNPLDRNTDMGPKVNKDEIEKLEELVNESIKEGGKLLLGGNRLSGEQFKKGYWFAPTVIEVENNDNVIMHEETFGPIAPMMKINNFEEAIKLANECDYGLSSYLFTNNAKYIMRMVNELDFGEVYVNRQNGELVNAFHNGYKLSGVGGEDGKYGLQAYLQKKTIYMNYNIK